MNLKSLRNKPSRNGFDLSFKRNFTAKAGELLPVMVKEVLPGDVFSPVEDLSTSGLNQARDGTQGGAFPGSVGTDQGDNLPFWYIKGNTLNGFDATVVDLQVLNTENWLTHLLLPPDRRQSRADSSGSPPVGPLL